MPEGRSYTMHGCYLNTRLSQDIIHIYYVTADNAFVCVIGGLLLVRVLQNRHPDILANAFVAFLAIALYIFCVSYGIVSYIEDISCLLLHIVMYYIIIDINVDEPNLFWWGGGGG